MQYYFVCLRLRRLGVSNVSWAPGKNIFVTSFSVVDCTNTPCGNNEHWPTGDNIFRASLLKIRHRLRGLDPPVHGLRAKRSGKQKVHPDLEQTDVVVVIFFVVVAVFVVIFRITATQATVIEVKKKF